MLRTFNLVTIIISFVLYKKANGGRECNSVLKDSHTGLKNHEGEHMTTKFTFLI